MENEAFKNNVYEKQTINMHDRDTYWMIKEHQDKVALGDSCRQFTGRSTEVEDMMASSEDKNATEDLNRDFHI